MGAVVQRKSEENQEPTDIKSRIDKSHVPDCHDWPTAGPMWQFGQGRPFAQQKPRQPRWNFSKSSSTLHLPLSSSCLLTILSFLTIFHPVKDATSITQSESTLNLMQEPTTNSSMTCSSEVLLSGTHHISSTIANATLQLYSKFPLFSDL